MKEALNTVKGRDAARAEADKIVMEEVRAASEERQALSASLRKKRIAKEEKEARAAAN